MSFICNIKGHIWDKGSVDDRGMPACDVCGVPLCVKGNCDLPTIKGMANCREHLNKDSSII